MVHLSQLPREPDRLTLVIDVMDSGRGHRPGGPVPRVRAVRPARPEVGSAGDRTGPDHHPPVRGADGRRHSCRERARPRLDIPRRAAGPSSVGRSAAVAADTSESHILRLAPGQPDFRILIVEDQAENWQLLRQLLALAGFQVRVAKNGAEGVAVFQAWRPHFIWMDWRMPVMDGVEATRRIRALAGRARREDRRARPPPCSKTNGRSCWRLGSTTSCPNRSSSAVSSIACRGTSVCGSFRTKGPWWRPGPTSGPGPTGPGGVAGIASRGTGGRPGEPRCRTDWQGDRPCGRPGSCAWRFSGSAGGRSAIHIHHACTSAVRRRRLNDEVSHGQPSDHPGR